MGMTTVEVEVANPKSPDKRARLEMLVDSGATISVVPAATLAELGIEPQAERRFALADGTVVSRWVGNAHWFFGGENAVAPVLFGEDGDSIILGALTLEALALVLDPFKRELRPALLRMG
jgi:clan AA aspartic protease